MEKYVDHLATLENCMKNTWATIGNYTNNTWVSFARHFAVIGGHLGDFLVTICGSYLFPVSSI